MIIKNQLFKCLSILTYINQSYIASRWSIVLNCKQHSSYTQISWHLISHVSLHLILNEPNNIGTSTSIDCKVIVFSSHTTWWDWVDLLTICYYECTRQEVSVAKTNILVQLNNSLYFESWIVRKLHCVIRELIVNNSRYHLRMRSCAASNNLNASVLRHFRRQLHNFLGSSVTNKVSRACHAICCHQHTTVVFDWYKSSSHANWMIWIKATMILYKWFLIKHYKIYKI